MTPQQPPGGFGRGVGAKSRLVREIASGKIRSGLRVIDARKGLFLREGAFFVGRSLECGARPSGPPLNEVDQRSVI